MLCIRNEDAVYLVLKTFSVKMISGSYLKMCLWTRCRNRVVTICDLRDSACLELLGDFTFQKKIFHEICVLGETFFSFCFRGKKPWNMLWLCINKRWIGLRFPKELPGYGSMRRIFIQLRKGKIVFITKLHYLLYTFLRKWVLKYWIVFCALKVLEVLWYNEYWKNIWCSINSKTFHI